jgi:hypothetical protein
MVPHIGNLSPCFRLLIEATRLPPSSLIPSLSSQPARHCSVSRRTQPSRAVPPGTTPTGGPQRLPKGLFGVADTDRDKVVVSIPGRRPARPFLDNKFHHLQFDPAFLIVPVTDADQRCAVFHDQPQSSLLPRLQGGIGFHIPEHGTPIPERQKPLPSAYRRRKRLFPTSTTPAAHLTALLRNSFSLSIISKNLVPYHHEICQYF